VTDKEWKMSKRNLAYGLGRGPVYDRTSRLGRARNSWLR